MTCNNTFIFLLHTLTVRKQGAYAYGFISKKTFVLARSTHPSILAQ